MRFANYIKPSLQLGTVVLLRLRLYRCIFPDLPDPTPASLLKYLK
jgi:hypothetical protein